MVAHASSFVLVLSPLDAFTAIAISALLLARGKRESARVACAVTAALTAAGVFVLPTEFYSSSIFEEIESWLGDWIFFLLALVPALLMVFIVLKLGGYAIDRHDA